MIKKLLLVIFLIFLLIVVIFLVISFKRKIVTNDVDEFNSNTITVSDDLIVQGNTILDELISCSNGTASILTRNLTLAQNFGCNI